MIDKIGFHLQILVAKKMNSRGEKRLFLPFSEKLYEEPIKPGNGNTESMRKNYIKTCGDKKTYLYVKERKPRSHIHWESIVVNVYCICSILKR